MEHPRQEAVQAVGTTGSVRVTSVPATDKASRMPAKSPENGRVLRGHAAPVAVHVLGRPRGPQSVPPPGNEKVPPLALASPSLEATVMEDARAHGYREGLEQGLREAMVRSQQQEKDAARLLAEQADKARVAAERRVASEASGLVSRLNHLLERLPVEVDARLDAAEDDMLALCMDALVRFLGDGVADPDRMLHWLRTAAREMRLRPVVAVHLHPDDLAVLRQAGSVMAAIEDELALPTGMAVAPQHEQARRVQWVADPSLNLGGCILKSPEGGLDASLETRLRLLSEVWRQAQSARPAERGPR